MGQRAPGAFGAIEVRGLALRASRFEATAVHRQLSVVSGELQGASFDKLRTSRA
jgi:hypothetical protein